MTTNPVLPATFVRTVTSTFGEDGTRWLADLPACLAHAATRWSLTLGPPFPDLSYNYAAPALLATGTEVVVKAGVPCTELKTEIAALELFGGRGCVRLLAADAGQGLLLLERLRPGTLLAALADDEKATRIAAGVAQRLWQPAPDTDLFPSVADWAGGIGRLRERFGGGTGPLPARLVDLAEGLFRELLASAGPPHLLHGDLHHFNILATRAHPAGWAAIDPKGVVGEPAYELACFLYNPLPTFQTQSEMVALLARRVTVFAEVLGFDRRRIAAWGVAQAVLSACWSVEDGTDDGFPTLRVAEALASLVN